MTDSTGSTIIIGQHVYRRAGLLRNITGYVWAIKSNRVQVGNTRKRRDGTFSTWLFCHEVEVIK